MSKEEYYLRKGGYIIGDAIGWFINKVVDKHSKEKEERQTREMLTPGNPNRILSTWQVELCDQALRKTLPHLPGELAGAIQEPARILLRDILLSSSS